MQDVVAGHVHMIFATAASEVGHIQDAKVRPLAVTTPKRTAILPEIATVAELGLPGFDATTWHGLVAPAGTPKEIIATLSRAMTAALSDPDVRRSLTALGVDIAAGSPEDFRNYIASEIPKWDAVVKASGARAD